MPIRLVHSRFHQIRQLDAPERLAIARPGKARRRCGLVPTRTGNAASASEGGRVGCVALSALG